LKVSETPVNFVQMSPECINYVVYNALPVTAPQQFYVDLETVSIGTQVRFGLWLPQRAILANRVATLSVSYGEAVSYTPVCDLFGSCTVTGTGQECFFVASTPELIRGRYFIWADAPRGSQVIVERWDPYIPIILPNRDYVATLNGPIDPNTLTNLPFTPNYQFYRLNINPSQQNFLLRVYVYNVEQGSVAVSLNTGYSPDLTPFASCSNADSTSNCTLEFSTCDFNSNFFTAGTPNVVFITIVGTSQLCELHSIKYVLNAQVTPVSDSFVLNSQRCDKVEVNDYHFYNLVPQNSGLN
jgi:hypothetical protein